MITRTNGSVKVNITTKNLSDSTANDTFAETTNSSLALKLELSINSSRIQSGQAVNISVSLFNTLSRINNVTGASGWAIPVLQNFSGDFFPCPAWESVLVSSGYYTQANISSSIPMNVSISSPSYCPNLDFRNYVFQPNSSQAAAYGVFENSSGITYNTALTSSNVITGFVSLYESNSGNITISSTPFSDGAYTIAAGDEWGQMVLLHFVVTSPTTNQTN